MCLPFSWWSPSPVGPGQGGGGMWSVSPAEGGSVGQEGQQMMATCGM